VKIPARSSKNLRRRTWKKTVAPQTNATRTRQNSIPTVARSLSSPVPTGHRVAATLTAEANHPPSTTPPAQLPTVPRRRRPDLDWTKQPPSHALVAIPSPAWSSQGAELKPPAARTGLPGHDDLIGRALTNPPPRRVVGNQLRSQRI
jgi:hypothetical protein